MLPTNGRLIFNGMNVTNEAIQATQGARLQVTCRGGRDPNWKMGTNNIVFSTTSTSVNVYQIKSPVSSILVIKSVKPSNAGKYTCHIGGFEESVTVGESPICY